jgi:uncharacterized integral membrane protein
MGISTHRKEATGPFDVGGAIDAAQPRDGKAVPREGEQMHVEPHPNQTLPHTESVEPRRERLRRHGHRTVLYTWAFGLVALLVVLIALVVANTRQVKLSWVGGSGHASLVWIILASAVLGWLLGIVTSVVFRLRTRRRRSPEDRADPSGA